MRNDPRLFPKFLHETKHLVVTDSSQLHPSDRFETRSKTQELCVEVVERISAVIIWSAFRVRVGQVIEGLPQSATDIKAASNAYSTYCIQSVGILKNSRF